MHSFDSSYCYIVKILFVDTVDLSHNTRPRYHVVIISDKTTEGTNCMALCDCEYERKRFL